MQQLLWFETLFKLSGGISFILLPLTLIKVLGLPPASHAFWPRLFGTLLIGLAGATFIEGSLEGSRGLGLAGCVLINLLLAGMIAALATLKQGAHTRRGSALLWLLAVLLLLLALIEIAHA